MLGGVGNQQDLKRIYIGIYTRCRDAQETIQRRCLAGPPPAALAFTIAFYIFFRYMFIYVLYDFLHNIYIIVIYDVYLCIYVFYNFYIILYIILIYIC